MEVHHHSHSSSAPGPDKSNLNFLTMRFEIKFYLPDCITGATIVLQKSEKKTIEQLEKDKS